MSAPRHIRTPLARVRGFGAARSGTDTFWHQRVSAVANVPLTLAAIFIIIMLLGSNQPAVARVLGSPLVAIIMLLFVVSMTVHMRIGMQVIIEDYVHHDRLKLVLLVSNSFFAIIIGLTSVFGILKLSFGL